MPGPTFIIELPIRVSDSESQTILRKLEFARQLHNVTLGSTLGQLQQLRQDRDWKKTCSMPKGKERTNLFKSLDRKYHLTEYDLHAVIAKHRQASGRKTELGINETQKNCYPSVSGRESIQVGFGRTPSF